MNSLSNSPLFSQQDSTSEDQIHDIPPSNPPQPLSSTPPSGPPQPLKSILKKRSTARVRKSVHFDSVNLVHVAVFEKDYHSNTFGRITSRSTPRPRPCPPQVKKTKKFRSCLGDMPQPIILFKDDLPLPPQPLEMEEENGEMTKQPSEIPRPRPTTSPSKQPLRRSARIAERKKRNKPLRRSARIAALSKVNYAV